jgi:hypothetical protein
MRVGSANRSQEDGPMRRIQVQHRSHRKDDSGRAVPPLDPRDPDVLRAKRLRERVSPVQEKPPR